MFAAIVLAGLMTQPQQSSLAKKVQSVGHQKMPYALWQDTDPNGWVGEREPRQLGPERLKVMPKPSKSEGILATPPAVPTFSDVATSNWYYGFMEEAAREGWVTKQEPKPRNWTPYFFFAGICLGLLMGLVTVWRVGRRP